MMIHNQKGYFSRKQNPTDKPLHLIKMQFEDGLLSNTLLFFVISILSITAIVR